MNQLYKRYPQRYGILYLIKKDIEKVFFQYFLHLEVRKRSVNFTVGKIIKRVKMLLLKAI